MTHQDLLLPLALLLLGAFMAAGRKRKRPVKPPDFLDAPLLEWPGVVITARDLCQGGALITGATGSGKSSGPRKAVLQANWAQGGGSATFVAKRDELPELLALVRKCGRSEDILVVDQSGRYRVNYARALDIPGSPDYALRAQAIAGGTEPLFQVAGRAGGGDDGAYWQRQADRCLFMATLAFLVANGVPPNPGEVLEFVQSLPNAPADLASDFFLKRRCGRTLAGMLGKPECAELYAAVREWVFEMAGLSDRTRGSITTVVTGLLSPLSLGVARTLLGSDTNLDFQDCFRTNKLLFFNFPYSEYMTAGKLIYTSFKHLICLEALRRDVTPESKLFVVDADEAQEIAVPRDALFAAQCRSVKCPLLYSSQGFESFYGAFGEGERDKAKILIGNLVLKFCCCPTFNTALEISEALGRGRTFVSNSSAQSGGVNSPIDLWVPGESRASAGVSETFESLVRPEELMRMRTGSKSNDYIVDSLLIQSGRIFPRTGGCYVPVAFDQRS